MATFLAVTRIEYSDPKGEVENGAKITFEPGQEVTGLPKETMKELWDAGALRQDDTVRREPAPTEDNNE